MNDGETPDRSACAQPVGAMRQKLEDEYGSSRPASLLPAPNDGNRMVKAWRQARAPNEATSAELKPAKPQKPGRAPPAPKPIAVSAPASSVFEQVELKAANGDKLFTRLQTAPDARNATTRAAAPWMPVSIYIGSFVINLLALAMPLAVFVVYDRILPGHEAQTLWLLMVALVGVVILDAALRVARAYIVGWTSANHEYAASTEAVSRILHAPPASIEAEPASVHAERLRAFDDLRDLHGGRWRLLLLDLPFVFLSLAIVGVIGGYLMLAPIALILLLGSVSMAGGTALRKLLRTRARHDDRRSDFIAESLNGIQTIKTMAMEPLFQRRFERLQMLGAASSHRTISLGNSTQIIGSLCSALAVVSVVTLGAYMVIEGMLTIGTLAACTWLSVRTIQPILQALDLWTEKQVRAVARGRIAALFELAPEECPPHSGVSGFSGAIALSAVSFAHGPDRPLVLKNINLEVEPGQIIGLCGRDGSGKSTLLDLIRGELEPTTGEVRLDSYDPSGAARGSLAKWLAHVPQEPTIFNGTVLENITMFRSGAAIDAAREAARLIGLESDIHHLPAGYDTILGEGITDELPPDLLQRISIVRALSRKPTILLFDEGNSFLDAQSDAMLRQGLEWLKGHTTVVLASQRSTLR